MIENINFKTKSVPWHTLVFVKDPEFFPTFFLRFVKKTPWHKIVLVEDNTQKLDIWPKL